MAFAILHIDAHMIIAYIHDVHNERGNTMKIERNKYDETRYAISNAGDIIGVSQSDITFGDDLKTKTPNIALRINSKVILLTWDECRDLATMLTDVADVSEFG